MHRFSVAFGKKKPSAHGDGFPQADAPSSFRVLERSHNSGNSMDTGLRGPRPTSTVSPPPYRKSFGNPDLVVEEENMFADLKINRASGSSNTTKTASTSTDTSSRHSNVSTAPSSQAPPPEQHASMHDDYSRMNKKPSATTPPANSNKSSGFLARAGRTFSFGGQKKHTIPPPQNNDPPLPVPSVPAHYSRPDEEFGRNRAMTASTTSTATPPKLERDDMDLGGDFGNMFSGYDKRASVATLRHDGGRGNRMSVMMNGRAPLASLPQDSVNANDGPAGGLADKPPPPPRHMSPVRRKPMNKSPDIDPTLLQATMTANKFLSENGDVSDTDQSGKAHELGWRQDDEENMFGSSHVSAARTARRYVAQPSSPPRSKVMTPAEFERYKQDKVRGELHKAAAKSVTQSKSGYEEDDEDNYDDDDDENEKSKRAAKQRRKQETHISVYRQQMMKSTGESTDLFSRPTFSSPSPAHHGNTLAAPTVGSRLSGSSGSPPLPGQPGASEGEDSDEEVPLAILAANGFPSKTRPANRLSSMSSNPNLRMSVMGPSSLQVPRPNSSMGEGMGGMGGMGSRSSAHLPAFARNLPQDPFLMKKQNRDSVAFSTMGPAMAQPPPPPQAAAPPGGLVGVIAQEERSRALRRGSPQIDGKPGGPGAAAMRGSMYDPITGIPPQAMYGMGGSPSMPHLPMMGGYGAGGMAMPMLTPGDQAQIQMTQQMQQFMQMQMQFMQMMANNNPGMARQDSFMPPQGMGMGDTPTRHSFADELTMDPPRLDNRMRTMSMVQPSSASAWFPPPNGGGYAPSIRVQGTYAPSIAPSERSNIGLPGRYRPVSQMPAPADSMRRVSTMSGALPTWDAPAGPKASSPLPKSGNGSDEDDDEDEGWEAMKAKREKKKSSWRTKKLFGRDVSPMIS